MGLAVNFSMHPKSYGDQSFLIAFIFWLALLTTNYNFNNPLPHPTVKKYVNASVTNMHFGKFGKGAGLQKKCCTATAIPFIYSFSGNSAASAPISTLMCLWAIYIFSGSVYIFPPAEQADPSWEYIICSETHECGNWDWGPDIPFLGIFVSNFRHFVFAVWYGKGQKRDNIWDKVICTKIK